MAVLPYIGETIWGFTATQLGTIGMLGAETVEFLHGTSGARLLHIRNDDQELGCNIIFRTPQKDETDANHVLEHLILSSCRKYPSRDIFFDMDSKSYSTFMNGLTDNAYTSYPLCTQSQEQLIKLMDVFLCCMESPDFLRERNFFLREGVRFELESPEGPLTLQGTVLSEDWGHLTDLQENADSITAKTLYPRMEASNLLGRAHLHYRELNYEQVQAAFYRNYRYSNCLIVLYGNMEYKRILEFLHKRHLSARQADPGQKTDPPFTSPGPEPGHRKCICQSPAYRDTPTEQAAVIDYAIDLCHSTQEELVYWDLFAGLMDHDASPWHKYAREQGLNNVMEAYLDLSLPLPSLKFRLRNGEPEQMEAFKASICRGLEEVKSRGVSPELYQASIKENRLSDSLTREAAHLGYHISEEIGWYWSVTDRTDYFQIYEAAFEQFSADEEQSIIKLLAEKALSPGASALTATLPKPGLAEELECERNRYLEETLNSMSASQRKKLIETTAAFRQWNAREWGNMDFLIKPDLLPHPPAPLSYTKKEWGSITTYTAPAPVSGVGSYQLYFNIGSIPQEDLSYLCLYQMLLTELDTGRYPVEQQKTLEQEYLHECTFDEFYPGPEAGPYSYPQMTVFWYGLTEDFACGLDFLLNIMGDSDYRDSATIIQVLEKYLPDYDLSKTDNAASLAFSLAESYIRRESCFRNLLNGQEIYCFLKNLLDRMRNDENVADVVAEKLRSISVSILGSAKTIFTASGPEEALEAVERQGIAALKQLRRQFGPPDCSQEGAAGASHPSPPVCAPYILPSQKQRLGVCVEASSQEIRVLGDFRGDSRFKGRYLPFLLACGDKYLKPAIRYQGGAYDSGVDFYIPAGYFSLWSAADPDIKSTLEVFAQAGSAIEGLSLTQKDLDGYILNAYAQALPPAKALGSRMRYMHRDIAGISSAAVNLMIGDIRRARLEDQQEAARIIQSLLEKGPAVTVGNERSITKNRGWFEEILDYRQN
ncbi:MAG: insulinase family protein [Clostridium sp.]|nr:insulinase family protein [Clostridium sp.]